MQLRTICLCRLILMLRSKINPEEPHKERKAQVGLLFLCDTPGKRLPCLHGQVFAPLRSVLNACHWHAAPFAGKRTATGLPGAARSIAEDREGLFPIRFHVKENLDTALHFPAGYLIIGKKGQESEYSTSLMRRGVYGKSIQYHSRL